MIAGPTQSGKTEWLKKLLSHKMFTDNIVSVLYCYGVYQDSYDEMGNIANLTFHDGVPSEETMREMNDGAFHIIVLDDLMELIVGDMNMQMLFTKFCHHLNFTTVFLTQNIFEQGRCARTIALNTHILVLFANRRDQSQIRTLARQQCPTQPHAFLEAYADATKVPFGYLVVDCSPCTPDKLRWRTRIFPDDDEGPMICYVLKEDV